MIDVAANRRMQNWTGREKIGRVLWGVIGLMFRFSPRPLWAWRRFLLRCFGADIGRDARLHPTVRITIPWHLKIGTDVGIGDRVILYALGPITIGDRATISQGAHLCAGSHDYRDTHMPLTKPPITIGAEVWICADAFVGPGVTVGDRAIVSARGVVMRDVASGDIVAGNPAQFVKRRDP